MKGQILCRSVKLSSGVFHIFLKGLDEAFKTMEAPARIWSSSVAGCVGNPRVSTKAFLGWISFPFSHNVLEVFPQF